MEATPQPEGEHTTTTVWRKNGEGKWVPIGTIDEGMLDWADTEGPAIASFWEGYGAPQIVKSWGGPDGEGDQQGPGVRD